MMDYEAVIPIKTVDDILKEIEEAKYTECTCENGTCKSETTEEKTNG